MPDKREGNQFKAVCPRCNGSGNSANSGCGICEGRGYGHPSVLSKKMRDLELFMKTLPEIK